MSIISSTARRAKEAFEKFAGIRKTFGINTAPNVRAAENALTEYMIKSYAAENALTEYKIKSRADGSFDPDIANKLADDAFDPDIANKLHKEWIEAKATPTEAPMGLGVPKGWGTSPATKETRKRRKVPADIVVSRRGDDVSRKGFVREPEEPPVPEIKTVAEYSMPMNFAYGKDGLPGTQSTTFDEIFSGQRRSTLRKIGQVPDSIKDGSIIEVVGKGGKRGKVRVTGRRQVSADQAEELSETERWTPEFISKYIKDGGYEQILYEPVDRVGVTIRSYESPDAEAAELLRNIENEILDADPKKLKELEEERNNLLRRTMETPSRQWEEKIITDTDMGDILRERELLVSQAQDTTDEKRLRAIYARIKKLDKDRANYYRQQGNDPHFVGAELASDKRTMYDEQVYDTADDSAITAPGSSRTRATDKSLETPVTDSQGRSNVGINLLFRNQPYSEQPTPGTVLVSPQSLETQRIPDEVQVPPSISDEQRAALARFAEGGDTTDALSREALTETEKLVLLQQQAVTGTTTKREPVQSLAVPGYGGFSPELKPVGRSVNPLATSVVDKKTMENASPAAISAINDAALFGTRVEGPPNTIVREPFHGNPVFSSDVSEDILTRPIVPVGEGVDIPPSVLGKMNPEIAELVRSVGKGKLDMDAAHSLALKSDIPWEALESTMRHASTYEALGPVGDESRRTINDLVKKYPNILLTIPAIVGGGSMIGVGVPSHETLQ